MTRTIVGMGIYLPNSDDHRKTGDHRQNADEAFRQLTETERCDAISLEEYFTHIAGRIANGIRVIEGTNPGDLFLGFVLYDGGAIHNEPFDVENSWQCQAYHVWMRRFEMEIHCKIAVHLRGITLWAFNTTNTFDH